MLIRMARIELKNGSALVDAFEQFLKATLPAAWELEPASKESLISDRGYDDAFLVTGPDGVRLLTIIQVKRFTEPAAIPRTAWMLRTAQDQMRLGPYDAVTTVLVSNFISERSRALLHDAGIGWFDLTGNTRIEAERPALFIERAGADRNPNTEPNDRRLKSLKGPGAARIVRALLDGVEDTRVRALAEYVGAGAATSARVLRYLAQEQLVERDRHAAVQRVHKRSLARAWARDYDVMRTNRAETVLAPRGLGWLAEQLAERHLSHVLTGSAALRQYIPSDATAVTPLSLLAVYSDETVRIKRELRLRDVERGANVLLMEPFDRVVLRGARESGGHLYTAPSQTVVDLLTSPGRGPEEADQLMETLASQDEEWTL